MSTSQTTGNIVQAQNISTQLGYASGALANWQKANKAISEANKATKAIDKAVEVEEAAAKASTALEQISKVSAGFGMAGAAFSLVATFLPKSDPQQMILQELQKIEAQIDNLQSLVVEKIDTLTKEIQAGNMEEQLSSSISTVKTILGFIKDYQDAARKEEDLSPLKKHFQPNQMEELANFASLINTLVLQTQFSGKQSYLDNIYGLSYGDASSIQNIGFKLLNYLISARSAYIFVNSFITIQDNGTNELQESQLKSINDSAVNNFDTVAICPLKDKLMDLLRRCHNERTLNVDRFINDYRLNMKLDQLHTNDLTNKLNSKWPSLSWLVICYASVKGFNNHGYSARGVYSKHWWGYQNSQSFNLIVHAESLTKNVGGKIEPKVTESVPMGLPDLFLFVQYGGKRDYESFLGSRSYFEQFEIKTWKKMGFDFKATDFPPSWETFVVKELPHKNVSYTLCWYLRRGNSWFASEPHPHGLNGPYTRGHHKGMTVLFRT